MHPTPKIRSFVQALASTVAHAHMLFDGLTVGRNGDANAPARDFGAYSVSFDRKALGIGETIEAAPGVKLTRRC